MNKKLFISVFLCFFVFSSGMVSGEKDTKGKIIEHLVWVESNRNEAAYRFYPTDDTQLEDFRSGPVLIYHVPASPKSEALFFDILAQTNIRWSGHWERTANVRCESRLISDIIPDNITVCSTPTVFWMGESNNSQSIGWNWERRTAKIRMRRNSVDWWQVYDESGEEIPAEDAIPIINGLIDNGFDVEVELSGSVKGIELIFILPVWIEVNRLVKE